MVLLLLFNNIPGIIINKCATLHNTYIRAENIIRVK